jgi:hypothetical protein
MWCADGKGSKAAGWFGEEYGCSALFAWGLLPLHHLLALYRSVLLVSFLKTQ